VEAISLVLLPGLDGTGKLFDPLISNLPDWIEPIVVSYPKDKPYGYDELKMIVSRAYPMDDDFFVLGESFSGPLAVMFAGEKPKGLKGIILCASFVKKPFRLIPAWLSIFSIGPIYKLWPATIILRSIFTMGKYEKLVKMALDAIKTVGPDVIAVRVKAILKVDVEKELMKCDIPMLYLAGRKDRLIGKHNISGIKRIKGDLMVTEVDTWHFILQLEPKKSADEIEKFIKSI
jgi:pimeloyl-ACP methyl ester carboxylesterase